jgi:hypothetical protein
MATKERKKPNDNVVVEPSGAASAEEATHEQRFREVQAMQEAAFAASAKQAKWRVEVGYAAREIERLHGLISTDLAAILERLGGAERAEVEESFRVVRPLAQAAAFVDRRAARQEEAQQVLSGEQYRAALKQVRADRALLFAQAPVWVTMGVLGAVDWASIQRGNGPLDWGRDVEDLAAAGIAAWDDIGPMQAVVFSDVTKRVTKEQLEAAALNARRLIAHIGRVESASPDLKKVDWVRHAKANRYLLALHWQRICDAAEYHYKRSGQHALIKERCVPLGALRKKKG